MTLVSDDVSPVAADIISTVSQTAFTVQYGLINMPFPAFVDTNERSGAYVHFSGLSHSSEKQNKLNQNCRRTEQGSW